ncbi:hypothetical protein TVAG_329580 [Trichomonas vaginalis G3]|uniref:Uncharacterized protein n=1 Tax=Trichomonas vaginalis (strain ATCC PRA-98 / G3) TaxID=412133 RepID=A2EBC6_TRIV3|nr:hypothetical protein TVAGG3_0309430 [Trichomonas vaginalis G3]EAY10071.1 hypothetical protein TVAG_329580 [Trichomonas vaginalis G3]KAI5528479.1 hypothetical protein TVAGG3_0309430 [Trichomonas vaginalis G3]|eukprot:XP_001322294.1 hypothetical protein [Trichomonas vaginalis G3]
MTLRYAHVPPAVLLYGTWSDSSSDNTSDENESEYSGNQEEKYEKYEDKEIQHRNRMEDQNSTDTDIRYKNHSNKAKNESDYSESFGFNTSSDDDNPHHTHVYEDDEDEFTKIQTVSYTEESIVLINPFQSEQSLDTSIEASLDTTLNNSHEQSESSESEEEEDGEIHQETLLEEEPISDVECNEEECDDEEFQRYEENLFDTSKIEQSSDETQSTTANISNISTNAKISQENEISQINKPEQEKIKETKSFSIKDSDIAQNTSKDSSQIQNENKISTETEKIDKKTIKQDSSSNAITDIKPNYTKSSPDKPNENKSVQIDQSKLETNNLQSSNNIDPIKKTSIAKSSDQIQNEIKIDDKTQTIRSEPIFPAPNLTVDLNSLKDDAETTDSHLLPKIRQLLDVAMETRRNKTNYSDSDDDSSENSKLRFIDVEEEPQISMKPIVETRNTDNLFNYICNLKENSTKSQISAIIFSIDHLYNIFSLQKTEMVLRITLINSKTSEKLGNPFDVKLRKSTKNPGRFKPDLFNKIVAVIPKSADVILNFALLTNRQYFASTRIKPNDKFTKSGKYFLQFLKEPGSMNCDITSKVKGLFSAKVRDPALEIQFTFAEEKDAKKMTKIPFHSVFPLCLVDSIVAFRDCLYIMQTTKRTAHYAQMISGFGGIIENDELLMKMSSEVKTAKKSGLTNTKFVEIVSKYTSATGCSSCTPFRTDELIPLKLFYSAIGNDIFV